MLTLFRFSLEKFSSRDAWGHVRDQRLIFRHMRKPWEYGDIHILWHIVIHIDMCMQVTITWKPLKADIMLQCEWSRNYKHLWPWSPLSPSILAAMTCYTSHLCRVWMRMAFTNAYPTWQAWRQVYHAKFEARWSTYIYDMSARFFSSPRQQPYSTLTDLLIGPFSKERSLGTGLRHHKRTRRWKRSFTPNDWLYEKGVVAFIAPELLAL